MGARAERARLGLRLGARRGRAAPTGRAGLGAAGPAVRRPGPSGSGRPAAAVATSRSAGGGSLLPLAARPGALFARPVARTRCEGARRGDDEWAGGARPGGSGTSGPAVKRAGTPPGSRPGSRAPGLAPGRGGRAGVRASRAASGKPRGTLPTLQITNGSSGGVMAKGWASESRHRGESARLFHSGVRFHVGTAGLPEREP